MGAYFERIRRHPQRLLADLFVILMLVVVIAWTLFPLYWAFINSIKFPYDVYGTKWIPWLQFEPTGNTGVSYSVSARCAAPSRTA